MSRLNNMHLLEDMVREDMAINGFNPYDRNDIELYWEEYFNGY